MNVNVYFNTVYITDSLSVDNFTKSSSKLKFANIILSAKYIVPVVPRGLILENHSIIIQNDVIIDILETSKALQIYEGLI